MHCFHSINRPARTGVAAALCAASAAALAGQHQICFEGAATAQNEATVVFACTDDSGGYCQVIPTSPGMVAIGNPPSVNVPGTVRTFKLLSAAATVDATVLFPNGVQRTCEVNAGGVYASTPGWATPGSQLVGYTSDESGLVSTGVWKLTSSLVVSANRQSAGVPADFVAVGGGAEGAEWPNGALVTESYQSDTISGAQAYGDWRHWTARTTDWVASNPHRTVTYVIGLRIAGVAARDLKPLLTPVIPQDNTPVSAAHPVSSVNAMLDLSTFPAHWVSASTPARVFLSGGAVGIADNKWFNGLGQFITMSAPLLDPRPPLYCPWGLCWYPTAIAGWAVESKDHWVSLPGTVSTAVISLPKQITVAGVAYSVVANFATATSAQAAHPSVDVSGLRGGYALTGIGASVDWKRYDGAGNLISPGNLIWKLQPRPDLGGATVASKDHIAASPATITGYAIGIKLVTPPINY